MESLIEYLKGKGAYVGPADGKAEPYIDYSESGESMVVIVRDAEYHGVRVDNFLTVYEAYDGSGIVGVQLKGLKRILDSIGSLGITVSNGWQMLTLIFLACSGNAEAVTRNQYRKVMGELKRQAPGDLALPSLSSPIFSDCA